MSTKIVVNVKYYPKWYMNKDIGVYYVRIYIIHMINHEGLP